MYKTSTLKNGLTLITIDLPHLESVTTLLAVGAGSRYEVQKNNGISHFLEHMFFKGSRKYPTAEEISTIIDGIGAVNNAATSKEWTDYWIKSAANHLELSIDILSSMLKEPLFLEEEIDREKGVIIEEMRMRKDSPQSYIWTLYEMLMYGDQPLGWDIIGDEKTINSINREDILNYTKSLYSPKNMVLVFAGKIPKNIKELSEKYFLDLPEYSSFKALPYVPQKQLKPKVDVYYKQTDQVNIALGVKGYDRDDPKKYAARVLAVILGEGMSSRLFIQVRERRGLAYHIGADHDPYKDTGSFAVGGGLKLEKVYDGIEVILAELQRTVLEKVTEDELKKAKDSIRGRLALRTESTNFLAEHFGIKYVLDNNLESFDQMLQKIDNVTAEDVRGVAKELFKKEKYNLQIIGPFKSSEKFEKIFNSL